MTWLLTIATLILIGIGLAIVYGKYRWQLDTANLRAKFANERQLVKPKFYREEELEGLPAPVQRFFRKVLRNGQPMIAAVKVMHRGQFNMSETEVKWNPFTSTQVAITQPPGFDWDGHIQMAPGVNAFVHDTYLLGKGNLHVSLLGLFALAHLHDTPELNQGELLRFFAEAAWYPTALLPSQGVRWEAIDDLSARGTLTDGATTASLVFRFNTDGAIDSVRADARYGTFGGKLLAMPWNCRFGEYTVQHGMSIPLYGEVEWERPEDTWLYFKGQIIEIDYEFVS
ncbi:DUF6544 family protein [Tumidithrix elongata RA019]|uniref:DUF6544 family protein n=1 Tax=Tumidithrix elongata BACA0141 TaxID=2716417 RepID=A0AAW9PVC4_9CYAN|nr:DUF6544 family protein [Tumidithrix elongata RA019]